MSSVPSDSDWTPRELMRAAMRRLPNEWLEL